MRLSLSIFLITVLCASLHAAHVQAQGFLPQGSSRSWAVEGSRVVPNVASPIHSPATGYSGFGVPSITGHTGVCGTCPPTCCPEVCVPCCECACDDSKRQWALEVGALGLFRSQPSSAVLLQNPLIPNEAVNARQFDFAAAAGVEAAFTVYHEHPQLAFEFRTQLPYEWQATVRQSFTGNSVNVGGTPPLVTTGPREATSVYASQYRSFLFDVRWKPNLLPETSWTLGVRSLTVDEALVSTLVDPAGTFPDEVVRSFTDNQLTGIHVGFDWNLISTCDLCLKLNSRAGLFANNASQSSRLESLATPPVIFPTQGSSTDAAGVFEAGLEARWKLSECLNATLGYRLMALSGVALASDQLQAIDFVNERGLDTNSTLVLQSLRIGLELHY